MTTTLPADAIDTGVEGLGEPDLRSLKEKWVDALRSGRFRQCRNYWSDKTGTDASSFCCIGVAGHIFGIGYAKYIELRTVIGMSFDVQDILFDMNDNKKNTFAHIADWIETHDLQTGLPLSSSEAPLGASGSSKSQGEKK